MLVNMEKLKKKVRLPMSNIVMRNQAKRVYKERTKNIPKKQRISFSAFFEQYKAAISKAPPQPTETPIEEDFDISSVANVNELENK